MIAFRELLRRLDRIILGPTRAEVEKSRRKPTIFISGNLPEFYLRVQSEFDIRLESREIEKIDTMDGLMGLIREKIRSEKGLNLNPHMIWGTLERLADEYVKK